MVRNYVRKTTRAKYPREDLEAALLDVKRGVCNASAASRKYSIPLNTLLERIKGRRGSKSTTLGRGTAISIADEKRLVSGLLQMEKYGFGLSRKEVLEIVGQFVRSNNINTPFKDGTPGEDWFLAFSKRNNLSIKKPQSVEIARKKSCNPFTIETYFKLLESTLEELGLKNVPHRIWNLDESSFCTDPSKIKVVGGKNLPCTRTTSAPGRENISVLLVASAAGDKVPPLIIFRGKNIWDQWQAPGNSGYPNTTYAATTNGWMEVEVFERYFEKCFLTAIGDERPVLLIYDGRSTHLSLKLIETACQSNVTILKLPPHTSHLLQPLDLSVFKPLKTSWDQELVKWQRQHVGARLPKREFSRIIGELWKNLKKEIIQHGFQKGGIYPFCRDVIPETMYDAGSLQRWREHHARSSETKRADYIVGLQNPNTTALIDEACTNPIIFLDNSDIGEQSIAAIDGFVESLYEEVDVDFGAYVTDDICKDVLHGPCLDLELPERDTVLDITKAASSADLTLSNTLTEEQSTSFEELLLKTMKAANNQFKSTDKKRTLAIGAEVITAEEARTRIQQEKQQKETKRKGTEQRRKLPQKKKLKKKLENKKLNCDNSAFIGEKAGCSRDNNNDDNLCAICLCDYRLYFDKKEWIQCVTCMQWICGICNENSQDLQYECPRCEDD